MPTTSFKNLYDVLGIDREASADDIRRAYRKKALETHPDKLDPSASEEEKQNAERQFHKVHEAFEILGDPIKRKAHDIRMKARTDPSLISAEATRRIKERKEWAERQREESLKRIAAFNKELEREKRAKEAALEKMKIEAAMVAEMLKGMYQSNPEFAARREAALQRKAEREHAEIFNRTQQPIHS